MHGSPQGSSITEEETIRMILFHNRSFMHRSIICCFSSQGQAAGAAAPPPAFPEKQSLQCVWTSPPSRTPDQGGILVRCPNPQLALFIAKEHQLYSEKPQTPDRGSSFLQDVSTISLFQSSPTARGRGWEQEPETLPPHREAGHPQRIY